MTYQITYSTIYLVLELARFCPLKYDVHTAGILMKRSELARGIMALFSCMLKFRHPTIKWTAILNVKECLDKLLMLLAIPI